MMTGQTSLSITCVVITLCIMPRAVDGISSIDASAFKADLTKDYDKNINPSNEYGEHIAVSVRFEIDSIGSIDEKLEKLTTIMSLYIEWKDDILTWDNLTNDIDFLTFDKSEVWVPEYFVYNTHYHTSFSKQDTRYMPVLIFNNGSAIFAQRLVAETTCGLDMSNFPFDRHTCTIEFVLNKHYVDVYTEYEKPEPDEFSPDGTWDVIDTSVDDADKLLVLSISVARKPTFFLINLISPMTMLALLSPLVFLLPNNCGDRIGFSVTILLALAVFMTMVADQVPQKSQPLPRLIYMLFTSYSLTTLVLIIVIINAKVQDFPDCKPVPCILVAVVTCMKCFCYCFRRRSATTKKEELEEDRDEDACLKDSEAEAGYKTVRRERAVTWQDVSWAIDMLAMTIIYILKIVLLVMTLGVRKSQDDEAN